MSIVKPWPRCLNCREYLFCIPCEDDEYEREQKLAAWAQFHPGEPCPELELE